MPFHFMRPLMRLGLGLAAGVASAVGAAGRPNLLLIVTDDQGWWDLGSSGNPHSNRLHPATLKQSGAQVLASGPVTLRAEIAAAPPSGELMRLNRV